MTNDDIAKYFGRAPLGPDVTPEKYFARVWGARKTQPHASVILNTLPRKCPIEPVSCLSATSTETRLRCALKAVWTALIALGLGHLHAALASTTAAVERMRAMRK